MTKMLLRFFLILFLFLAQGYGHLHAHVVKSSSLYLPVKTAVAKQIVSLNNTSNSSSTFFQTTKEKEVADAATDIFEEEKDDEEVSVRKSIVTSNYFINYFCTQAEEYFNSFLVKRLQNGRHFLFPSNTKRYIMLCVIKI